LPLEYGVIYCLYMTIDGALYRAGLKNVGRYARFTQGEHEYAKVVAGQAGDTASLMNEIGRIKKTPAEKERMMDSLKIARLEIFERVHQNLPEQLRNQDEINRVTVGRLCR
jgi:hypothetical protein